ncbi:MAG: LysR family transcriptional regulator [Deltaproteobacteria bacterium]|nr:LysR family transcriptional regulator [Deltaproteobacteria bacterium]
MAHTTLRQLQIFETVARLKGFTRAAEVLYITQPTVSMQIKRLTEVIELPLFERVGKKLHLTSAGEKVYHAAIDILNRLKKLDDDISDLKGVVKGDLRISVVVSAKYFIPHLLGAFIERYPEVTPHVTFTNRAGILKHLENNVDDLVLMGKVPQDIHVTGHSFLKNQLVVVASPANPLVNQKRISLKQLLKERFIEREHGSGTKIAVGQLFSEHHLKTKPFLKLGSSEAIKQGVMAGLGISVLSIHNIRIELESGLIKILDVEGFPLQRQWFAAYSSTKSLTIVARSFIDFIVNESEKILSL